MRQKTHLFMTRFLITIPFNTNRCKFFIYHSENGSSFSKISSTYGIVSRWLITSKCSRIVLPLTVFPTSTTLASFIVSVLPSIAFEPLLKTAFRANFAPLLSLFAYKLEGKIN